MVNPVLDWEKNIEKWFDLSKWALIDTHTACMHVCMDLCILLFDSPEIKEKGHTMMMSLRRGEDSKVGRGVLKRKENCTIKCTVVGSQGAAVKYEWMIIK